MMHLTLNKACKSNNETKRKNQQIHLIEWMNQQIKRNRKQLKKQKQENPQRQKGVKQGILQ